MIIHLYQGFNPFICLLQAIYEPNTVQKRMVVHSHEIVNLSPPEKSLLFAIADAGGIRRALACRPVLVSLLACMPLGFATMEGLRVAGVVASGKRVLALLRLSGWIGWHGGLPLVGWTAGAYGVWREKSWPERFH